MPNIDRYKRHGDRFRHRRPCQLARRCGAQQPSKRARNLAGGVVGPGHDVAAKAEVPAFGAHQHDARVTAFDRVDRCGQFVNHLVADADLRRAIENDRGNAMLDWLLCCRKLRLREVFLEPVQRGGTGLIEFGDVRIEVAARDRHEALRLKGALVGGQLEIGQRDRVLQRDDHQQRRGRHARNPRARFVHARGARRAHRDAVLPGAVGHGLQIELDGILGAVRSRDGRIGADDRQAAP